jgi:hypothetical protein
METALVIAVRTTDNTDYADCEPTEAEVTQRELYRKL